MIDTPHIVQTAAQPTACIHLVIPREDAPKVMGPGYRELMDAVTAQGVAPAGPWLNHHLKNDPGIFDFEISVPVTAPVSPVGRVRMGELPAARVARTVYHGPYEGLPAAWREFESWIAAEGHTRLQSSGSATSPARSRAPIRRPGGRSSTGCWCRNLGVGISASSVRCPSSPQPFSRPPPHLREKREVSRGRLLPFSLFLDAQS